MCLPDQAVTTINTPANRHVFFYPRMHHHFSRLPSRAFALAVCSALSWGCETSRAAPSYLPTSVGTVSNAVGGASQTGSGGQGSVGEGGTTGESGEVIAALLGKCVGESCEPVGSGTMGKSKNGAYGWSTGGSDNSPDLCNLVSPHEDCGPCVDGTNIYGSGDLLGESEPPGGSFIGLYNNLLGELPGGPFAIELRGADKPSDLDRSIAFGGISSVDGSLLKLEEAPVEVSLAEALVEGLPAPEALSATVLLDGDTDGTKTLNVPRGYALFKLWLNDGVQVEVREVELSASLSIDCTEMTDTTVTLYIHEDQGAVQFNGVDPLGAVLGTKNASIASGTNNGWRVTFSGKANPGRYL